ncbi:hypothetical protein HNQ59_003228 [Chitinivorax tropicus]|uniref:Uncharacterized protein n=1 Tax=Chitinivorax tropicus TaxID=714531 RepID=A0A840MNB8_9PROT|nr:hypothetical protein [Chitinivorax tropicus]MBB5019920.1 hypothetical protein [Chitinivorax tropicus]
MRIPSIRQTHPVEVFAVRRKPRTGERLSPVFVAMFSATTVARLFEESVTGFAEQLAMALGAVDGGALRLVEQHVFPNRPMMESVQDEVLQLRQFSGVMSRLLAAALVKAPEVMTTLREAHGPEYGMCVVLDQQVGTGPAIVRLPVLLDARDVGSALLTPNKPVRIRIMPAAAAHDFGDSIEYIITGMK